MTIDRPLVLVAGAASRDIVADDPRGWRLGGAVTYGALTLARLGLRVRALIGVDAEAADATELYDLRAAGVEVHLLPLRSGPVFENVESPSGRRQRCIATSDVMRIDGIPSHWADDLRAVFLGPVAGELDGAWAAVQAPLVALGWQGLLRELHAGSDVVRVAPRREPLLGAASLVGASLNDFALGTTPQSLVSLLGPSATLVLTEGEAGGRVLRTDAAGHLERVRRYPGIPSDGTVDPTGAGDVFLAAMVAARLQRSTGVATRFAAAAASLAVEGRGLAGIPDLAAVRARVARAPSLARRRDSPASSRASGRPSQA